MFAHLPDLQPSGNVFDLLAVQLAPNFMKLHTAARAAKRKIKVAIPGVLRASITPATAGRVARRAIATASSTLTADATSPTSQSHLMASFSALSSRGPSPPAQVKVNSIKITPRSSDSVAMISSKSQQPTAASPDASQMSHISTLSDHSVTSKRPTSAADKKLGAWVP